MIKRKEGMRRLGEEEKITRGKEEGNEKRRTGQEMR